MIIRGNLQCEECGHAHIVRIGMGQETRQRHQFHCRSCHEPIEVGLVVDYTAISAEIIYGKNAIELPPQAKGVVVNLDANYLIPDEVQGKELVFPRLAQSAAVIQKLMADRRARGLSALPEADSMPARKRPDFAAEWNDLRAAWSLARNGKDALSAKRVEDFSRFAATFSNEISKRHGSIFFELLRSYFASFDEFSQVQLLVTSELSFDEKRAASSDFDAVRMFYGNAFEAFSSLAEYLAYLNNLIAGRKFDEFSSMTREKYLQLDKASRFRCFEDNQAFAPICVEADNVLRNASHHGGFTFDVKAQDITYRAGKGGQGDEQHISYTAYLRRCAEIFMQAIVLFRFELILANNAKLRPPL